MAEATKGENPGEFKGEIEQLAPQIFGNPRDLLTRLGSGSYLSGESPAVIEESCENELNLGLSLGGCFGVDIKETKLVRSTSVTGITTLQEYDDVAAPSTLMGMTALTRTWSVPADAEEERRKRKEAQSVRRLEAKRKRSEKQKGFLGFKDLTEVEKRGEDDRMVGMAFKVKVEVGDGCSDLSGSTVEMMNHQTGVSNGLSSASCTSRGTCTGAVALAPFVRFSPSSQGSLGSQGSSASGISDIGNRSVKGLPMDARPLSRAQSLPETVDQKAAVITHVATTIARKSGKLAEEDVKNDESNKSKIMNNGLMRNVMEEMPSVSARGDGPNGRKIEGFLYNYKKGEEVSIVCVCHGSFLSPAEFVRHAGGGDVAHPLRHILVNPSYPLL